MSPLQTVSKSDGEPKILHLRTNLGAVEIGGEKKGSIMLFCNCQFAVSNDLFGGDLMTSSHLVEVISLFSCTYAIASGMVFLRMNLVFAPKNAPNFLREEL